MKPLLILLPALVALAFPMRSPAAEEAAPFRFSQSARKVAVFEYVEVTAESRRAFDGNPFTDATCWGELQQGNESPLRVDGFCDSEDGRLFRIRFLPVKPGKYRYTVHLQTSKGETSHRGEFAARPGGIPGPVRVDPAHPFHFIRDGAGGNPEHWFWNGTTTYQILAWDDATIRQSIDRLGKLGVNRIRVALCGRTPDGARWNEPLVHRTERFKFKMEPWPAARPDDQENPGYDVTRFNLELFRKAERLLEQARAHDMNVSIIFYVDGRDKGVDPFGHKAMGGSDEQRYYRYVIARLAAYPNVMWDVANEYRLFRNDSWAEQMGAFVKECDPYGHLTSTHGHGDFRFRTSRWADFAMYQQWDESGGYQYMLKNRRDQLATGRPMPQINEEYGYEDHYPTGWGGARTWPARIADNRRRLAWEMVMAGCYQTTGERANQGTGAGPDTGGGWVNGRGDEHMTMLLGYAHMMKFFTSLAWWSLEPREDLAQNGTLLLARPGECYAAWLPKGGAASFQVEPGKYRARWFNPRTGQWFPLPEVASEGAFTSGPAPDAGDWALLLESVRRGVSNGERK